MPSDSQGVYSLPDGYLAVTGENILASEHNPPLEDLAAAVTGRLPRSGVAPMTGPLKLPDGSVGAPALTFNSASNTGIYKTTNGWGIAIGGVSVAEFTSTGLSTGLPDITNAMLAQMAAHTFKGNNTGATGDALDLTAAQLTAELNAVVGDAGSGGTKGLVPAPAAGDAAAGKFLNAAGVFAVPAYPIVRLTKEFVSSTAGFSNELSFPHSLGEVPKVVDVRLICTGAVLGYSVGDEVPIADAYFGSFARWWFTRMDATAVTVHVDPSTPSTFRMYAPSAGSIQDFATGNWGVKVRAWA